MLSHEVIEAVKKGKFHIWSVKTIDEGIESLIDVSAGTADENGEYPAESIRKGQGLPGGMDRPIGTRRRCMTRSIP